MRGAGFECDNCSVKVVLADGYWRMGDWRVPDGWVQLAENNEGVAPLLFCGWFCLVQYGTSRMHRPTP